MHNPKAGSGKHDKKKLMVALAKAGHRATYQSTKEKNYKKALKKPTDVVLVAGGDGTVGKIGRELIDSGIPLSVLPLGTANNLARSLGFIAPVGKIIRQLRRGKKRAFDVGVARGPWGKRYFFESVGGGLFADYLRKSKREDKRIKDLSKEQEMTRHVALLRRMLHKYPPQKWKIEIDGKDVSGRYLLWEAMNIRSVGPALYLASQAATHDGHLDFVDAREEDRSLFITYLDAWLSGQRKKFPLPISRFRELKALSKNPTLHLDGKSWPSRKGKRKSPIKVEITVKPSALVILQPAALHKKRR
jgi:diacylglycerol kinase family enzyme